VSFRRIRHLNVAGLVGYDLNHTSLAMLMDFMAHASTRI
jgi:hypothetical protein